MTGHDQPQDAGTPPLWRSLAAFPADPAVANLATSVVTRAEAREREAVP